MKVRDYIEQELQSDKKLYKAHKLGIKYVNAPDRVTEEDYTMLYWYKNPHFSKCWQRVVVKTPNLGAYILRIEIDRYVLDNVKHFIPLRNEENVPDLREHMEVSIYNYFKIAIDTKTDPLNHFTETVRAPDKFESSIAKRAWYAVHGQTCAMCGTVTDISNTIQRDIHAHAEAEIICLNCDDIRTRALTR